MHHTAGTYRRRGAADGGSRDRAPRSPAQGQRPERGVDDAVAERDVRGAVRRHPRRRAAIAAECVGAAGATVVAAPGDDELLAVGSPGELTGKTDEVDRLEPAQPDVAGAERGQALTRRGRDGDCQRAGARPGDRLGAAELIEWERAPALPTACCPGRWARAGEVQELVVDSSDEQVLSVWRPHRA